METQNRKRSVETQEQVERRPPRRMAEFAIESHDQQLIDDLQTHLLNHYGERRQRSRILRASNHYGLLVEIILAGPDKNDLYAGRYTGKEIAEMTRQQALLLGDVQARYSSPIFQASVMGTSVLEIAKPNVEEQGTTSIDLKGAAALKGLGAGLMKRKIPSLPPPN